MTTQSPHVVIIGGGFAGLAAAKALRGAPCQITLIDRKNHHVFQPLLYQVATAALSPANIASPIRHVFRHQRNCRVLMATARHIDVATKRIDLDEGAVTFDILVLATGATHSYFGKEHWAYVAPGLKTIEDALEIRRRFLTAFELAEREEDPQRRRELLTFVIVGAGPTGVETAGAMVEIALHTIPREFRLANTRLAHVILVEAMDRVLPTGFPPAASERALRDLRAMGVDVRLGTRVTSIDAHGVDLSCDGKSQRLAAGNVIWAAGVAASPLGRSLGLPVDRAGRVIVQPDCTLPGHPEVYVIGDLAHIINPATNEPVPGMAPGAMQMGRYVGAEILAKLRGHPSRGPFRFVDKGVLATIGRARAVAVMQGRTFGGFLAWVLWAALHIFYLIDFRSRLIVCLEWLWAYAFFERGARLITNSDRPDSPAA